MSKRAKNVKRIAVKRQLPFVYWGMLVRYNGVFGNIIDGGGGLYFKIRLVGQSDYHAGWYHPWTKGLEYLTERGDVIIHFKDKVDYKTQLAFLKSIGLEVVK